jgi:peptide/nickel transport system permease protein
MAVYVVRRLILMMPTMLGISFVVFMMVRFLPGSAVDLLVGEYSAASPEIRQELRERYSLNDSIPSQYFNWISGIVRGDLGDSIIGGRSVSGEIKTRIVPSIELAVLAMAFGLLIALPIGILAAIRADSWLDYITRSSAIAFLSLPGFWIATLIITLPGRFWQWTPPLEFAGITEDPVKNLSMLLIPSLIVALGFSGTVMRLTRAQMLEVLHQDFIRTAWSKGLRERSVITGHALRNSLIPVVTVIGIQIPALIGGIVIIETIFGIPGIGSYLYGAISSRDYPIVQGVNLVVALIVLLSNLCVDVMYAYLDPRIRYA